MSEPNEQRPIRSHRDLDVYRVSFDTAMEILRLAVSFPSHETYALKGQILRSSRSVSANVAEAWRKRRYQPAFVAKLSDAEPEAAKLYRVYERLIGSLVGMIRHADRWVIRTPKTRRESPDAP